MRGRLHPVFRYGFAQSYGGVIAPSPGLVAPTIRSTSGLAYGGGRSSTTITPPAGLSDNDILLLFQLVGRSGSLPAITYPSGFASAGVGPSDVDGGGFFVRFGCQWKRASGESGDYVVNHDTGSSAAFLLAIQGAKTSGSPINAASVNSGTGATSLATGITTDSDECLSIFGMHDFGDFANDLTAPTGMDELLDSVLRYYAEETLAVAGATGDRSMTNNNNPVFLTNPWGAYLVAISPAGA